MKKFLEEFKAFALRGNVKKNVPDRKNVFFYKIIAGKCHGHGYWCDHWRCFLRYRNITDRQLYQSDPECAYRRSNVYTEGCIRICFILCLISDQFCDHGIYSFLSSEGGKQDHFHRSKKRGRACTNYEGMSVLQK